MELKLKTGDILKTKADCAVIPMFEGKKTTGLAGAVDKELGGAVTKAAKAGEFTGKAGETMRLDTSHVYKTGPARVLLVGLGGRDKFTPDALRRAAGKAATAARDMACKAVTASVDGYTGLSARDEARLWTEGSMMALYVFAKYKAADKYLKELGRLTLCVPDKKDAKDAKDGAAVGVIIADSVAFTRDMVNAPANVMTPSDIAGTARRMAKSFGISIQVLEEKDCKSMGMGAYLGVASGSEQPAKFIIMQYHGGPKNAKPTVLIGKGITFDSGGISLKPPQGMEKMKYDMAGGAAIVGVMRAAAALKLKTNLIGIVPATENLPSGSAYKPGDVVRAMNGKTVEIISTDAEGRMVLADALCYSECFKPRVIIDVATLTGACVIALGDQAMGLMGNDQGLIHAIRDASERSSERVWQLPMWEEYLEPLKGEVTDLKNVGGREAGTIAAGKFLEQFVPEGTPWAHLDIAGTAWEEKGQPYLPKGSRGTAVRLLVEYLMGRQ